MLTVAYKPKLYGAGVKFSYCTDTWSDKTAIQAMQVNKPSREIKC